MKAKSKKAAEKAVSNKFLGLVNTLDFENGDKLMSDVFRVKCEDGTAYKIGALTFFSKKGKAKNFTMLKGMKPVKIRHQESIILEVLLKYPLRYAEREDIIKKVWKEEIAKKIDCAKRLNVTISRMKKSLLVEPRISILCSRNSGYMLYVEPLDGDTEEMEAVITL